MNKNSTNIYALGFIVYCLIAGSLFFYINKSSQDINHRINQLISDFQTKRHSIAEMSEATKVRVLLLVQMSGTDDFFKREELTETFYQQGTRYLKAREHILSIKLNSAENAEMVRIWDSVVIIAPRLREVAELLLQKGNEAQAVSLLQDVLPVQQEITKSFEKLITSISEQVANRQRLLQSELINHQQLIFLLFIISVMLAVITLTLMQRNQVLLAKASQTALLEKKKAQKANQEKSQFLANMSHELRTPMHAILNFTVLALKRAEDQKQQKFLQNIRTSGIRLTSLLDDLLDLSKLEAKKMDVNFVFQDMTTIIERAVSEISSLASRKGIMVNLDTGRHFECMFDQKLIFQVLVNLLSNAIKFSPDNSSIDIGVEYLESGSKSHPQNMVEVSVTDNGVGIPNDQLDSVFDKFFQSSATRSNAGGTGLGLPICKEIITLHNGKIWGQSPPGGRSSGSVFRFRIPVIQAGTEKLNIPDIQAAIDSHVRWKNMIEAMIIGQGNLETLQPLSEINTHLCPLGQWMDTVDIGGNVFNELKRIHNDFHLLAGEIIAYHETGQDYAKSEKLVEFQQASDQIIYLLKSLHFQAPDTPMVA